jgi:hypothetical protein
MTGSLQSTAFGAVLMLVLLQIMDATGSMGSYIAVSSLRRLSTLCAWLTSRLQSATRNIETICENVRVFGALLCCCPLTPVPCRSSAQNSSRRPVRCALLSSPTATTRRKTTRISSRRVRTVFRLYCASTDPRCSRRLHDVR